MANDHTSADASRIAIRRRWKLITVLALVITGAVLMRLIPDDAVASHRLKMNAAAGPAVPAAPFMNIWTDRPVMLVGIGDSVTRGFGTSADHSYFARLEKNPDDEFREMKRKCLSVVLPNLTSRNLSMSGSTSLHCMTELKRLPKQKPATMGIVVMTTGGNDLIHNYGRGPIEEGAMYGATFQAAQKWIGNYRKRLNRVFDTIDGKFPGGCHIFIANIYDPTDGRGDIEKSGLGLPRWRDGLKIHAAYNKVIKESAAARANTHLVDMHAAFLGHGIHYRERRSKHYRAADPTYWYFNNFEDPNDRGYDAIRRIFLLEIIRFHAEFGERNHVQK